MKEDSKSAKRLRKSERANRPGSQFGPSRDKKGETSRGELQVQVQARSRVGSSSLLAEVAEVDNSMTSACCP